MPLRALRGSAVFCLLFVWLGCSQPTKTNSNNVKPINDSKTPSNTNSDGPIGSSKKNYAVAVDAAAEAKVGAAFTAKVVLTPAGEFHVNKEYPHMIKLDPMPAGVECTKTEYKNEDAKKMEDSVAEFEISCTAKEPGAKEFQALYKLGVCTEAGYCQSPKEKLAWKVDVK